MRNNQKGFSEIILILVIVALLGVVGFFVYQNYQLKQTDSEVFPKASNIPTQTTTPNGTEISASTTPSATNVPTTSWKTYSSKSGNFTIKHPKDWRKVETDSWVGFGPNEIGEDVH